MLAVVAEATIVAMRWAHLLAAVAFIGSAFFYAAFLSPSLGSEAASTLAKAIEVGFRELVDVSLAVFLLSGAILTFDRLSGGQASTLYVALLGLKIGLAMVMFHIAYRMRQGGLARSPRSLRALVAVGCVVLLLAIALRAVYTEGSGIMG